MATKAILDFLEEHNRPFSATDIQNGVKTEIGKSAMQKALDSLVEKDQVREKAYGKQKVYFIKQNTDMAPNEMSERLLAMDRKINEVQLKLKEKIEMMKENMSRFQKVQGKMTLPEACQKKIDLENELRSLKHALKEFDGVEPITPEEKKKIQTKYDTCLSQYKKRKRMCTDILDAILENYPKTKSQLFEDIGIETDQDAGFSLDKL